MKFILYFVFIKILIIKINYYLYFKDIQLNLLFDEVFQMIFILKKEFEKASFQLKYNLPTIYHYNNCEHSDLIDSQEAYKSYILSI